VVQRWRVATGWRLIESNDGRLPLRLRVVLGLSLATLFASQSANAQLLVESYQTYLSDQDHLDSRGQRLLTAAQVIRRDRINHHRTGLKDAGDEDESFFEEKDNRAQIEQLLERGRTQPDVLSQIVTGTPHVQVAIFEGTNGPYMTITVLK
jgi:hypothetical protein